MSLRVCFVVESGTDVRLAEGLAEGAALRILARRVTGGREISQPSRREIPTEIGPSSHLRFALFAAARLLRLRNEIDVVLVQGYGPAAACVNLTARLVRCPVLMLVCSPAEAYYRCRKNRGSKRPYRTLELVAISVFSRVNAVLGQGYIALSHYLASVIRTTGARSPIDVIPVYGVDRSIFRPDGESKMATRQRLGIADDLPVVFFSSRVAPEKDVDTVLEAVAILGRSSTPVRLLHLSGGHDELMERAKALGCARFVQAGPAVAPFEHLADSYRASDVCVQSSREEGLGFSPLEALACGVPVVATAVGGLKETIREGETGWQVPAGDAPAMARAIAEVLGNPSEALRRTAAGAAEIDVRFERRIVFAALHERLRRAALRFRMTAAAAEPTTLSTE